MSPITPDEVAKKKGKHIPKEVFDAFDALIVENYVNGKAVVTQHEVVTILNKKLGNLKTEWLNVEEAYEAAGWRVEYDKPGYCETYKAAFTFTRKTPPASAARSGGS